MNNNTCSTCKYWNRDDSTDHRVPSPSEVHGPGLCMLHSSTDEKSLKEQGYDVDQMREYKSKASFNLSGAICNELYTYPNFGCVGHSLEERRKQK